MKNVNVNIVVNPQPQDQYDHVLMTNYVFTKS